MASFRPEKGKGVKGGRTQPLGKRRPLLTPMTILVGMKNLVTLRKRPGINLVDRLPMFLAVMEGFDRGESMRPDEIRKNALRWANLYRKKGIDKIFYFYPRDMSIIADRIKTRKKEAVGMFDSLIALAEFNRRYNIVLEVFGRKEFGYKIVPIEIETASKEEVANELLKALKHEFAKHI